MSTNRTENYQLHVWGAEDEERLEEVNENFTKLEMAIDACQMVTGSYQGVYMGSTGQGQYQQTITLGFRPRVALIMANMAASDGNAARFQALLEEGVTTSGAALTDDGFTVSGNLNQIEDLNLKPNPYRYIAWK